MSDDVMTISRSTMQAADIFFGGGPKIPPTRVDGGRPPYDPTLVEVRNDTGGWLLDGYLVGLDGLAFPWEGQAADAEKSEILMAIAPDPANPRMAAVLDAIAPGDTGLCRAHGVVKLRVRITDTAHRYATPITGEVTMAESAISGSLLLFHTPPAAGIYETLVYLPCGGGVTTKPMKPVYAPYSGTGGKMSVFDKQWTSNAEDNPSWTLVPGTLHEGRYEIGDAPREVPEQ